MAQELKELCHILDPQSSTEKAEYFSDISEYIRDLGSQNWEYICKEPERLAEEMKQITEQTQDLAFTNYKTFVASADVSRAIMKDLGKSKDSLTVFLDTMPSFVQECERFSQIAGNIMKEKSQFSNVHNQSDKLLELLELPSLMREALNADDYESALDIFTFIRNLSTRYSQIPIIQNTTSEIMTLWFETLYHLFNQLRYDLPLPQCLQILGYLRRANTVYKSTGEESGQLFNDDSNNCDGLHLHFLKARNAWFENALEEAKNNESPDKLLRKIIELHRIHLFNILTQHKSIFLSVTPESQVKDDQLNGNCALSSWFKQKVAVLSVLVEEALEGGEEGALEGAASQWRYLGASCGRVGADLRGALASLPPRRLAARLALALRRAAERLPGRLARLAPRPRPRSHPHPAPAPARAPGDPPHELLDCHPLAEFCNALLSALNALRPAAPLCLARAAAAECRRALEAGARAVAAAAAGAEAGAGAGAEAGAGWGAVARLYAGALAPHVAQCLAHTFPAPRVAEALGVTLSALHDSALLQLDLRLICQPLEAVPDFGWS